MFDSPEPPPLTARSCHHCGFLLPADSRLNRKYHTECAREVQLIQSKEWQRKATLCDASNCHTYFANADNNFRYCLQHRHLEKPPPKRTCLACGEPLPVTAHPRQTHHADVECQKHRRAEARRQSYQRYRDNPCQWARCQAIAAENGLCVKHATTTDPGYVIGGEPGPLATMPDDEFWSQVHATVNARRSDLT